MVNHQIYSKVAQNFICRVTELFTLSSQSWFWWCFINFQDRGRNHIVWLFKWNFFVLSLSLWRKFHGETNRMKASEHFFLQYIFRVRCSNFSNAVLLWGILVQFGSNFRVSERNPLVWSSGKRISFGALFRCSWSWFHFSSESRNKIVCFDHSNRTFSSG